MSVSSFAGTAYRHDKPQGGPIAPLLDLYADYQVNEGANEPLVTLSVNGHIAHDGGIVTWTDNRDGARPFGNDLDPILNLDVPEVTRR